MTDRDAFDAALRILWAQRKPTLTEEEIAAKLGRGRPAIQRAKVRLRLPDRPKPRKLDYQQVRKMLAEGMDESEIAAKLDREPASVAAAIAKMTDAQPHASAEGTRIQQLRHAFAGACRVNLPPARTPDEKRQDDLRMNWCGSILGTVTRRIPIIGPLDPPEQHKTEGDAA
jgi:hypothetical protein